MLSSRRRDRLTIMAQILNMAREGDLKSSIMLRAKLSFAQLNEYFFFLQEVELLEVDTKEGKTIYKTTPKGVKYLETFSKLKACMYGTGNLITMSTGPPFSISKERQVFIINRE